jgi:hypothetical protein
MTQDYSALDGLFEDDAPPSTPRVMCAGDCAVRDRAETECKCDQEARARVRMTRMRDEADLGDASVGMLLC